MTKSKSQRQQQATQFSNTDEEYDYSPSTSMMEKTNENNSTTTIVTGKSMDRKKDSEGVINRREFAKRLSNRSRIALTTK